jgi:tetratricopeptide (TPR) repeat protein
VEKELIPEVEARYQPMPYRVFSGHSLGGLMALHALIDRPYLFNAYIVADPSLWWDDQKLLKHAEVTLRARSDIRNKVFIAVAEHQPRGETNSTLVERAGERFAYALEANPSPHLYSAIKQYPGEDHNSVAMPSLYDGLRFVFDGYKAPPASVASQGLDEVVAYYRDYLGAYGVTLQPSSGVITDMTRLAQENGEIEKALEYAQYNVTAHPDDPFVYFMLAQVYEEVDEADLAIDNYQKIIEMAPHFAQFVQPELDKLLASEDE